MKIFDRTLFVTLTELLTLIVWLFLLSAGHGAIAAAILVTGLTIEHIIASRNIPPFLELLGVSASESAIWIIWKVIANSSPITAFIFLFVTMFIQHNVELNSFARKPLFSRLLDRRVTLFTALEAVGGAVWLALTNVGHAAIGGAILGVGLQLEHQIQARKLAELQDEV